MMELTVTRTSVVRKAILWLKVNQDQHSELQVVAITWQHFRDNYLCVVCAGTHLYV